MNKFENPMFEKEIGLTKELEKNLEIERKFLIKTLPANINSYSHQDITQGYIVADKDHEIRLRKKGDKYFKTIKTGSGKIRTEEEYEITKEQFETEWPLVESRIIDKTRYKIPYQNHTIELDIYKKNLDGLLTAEVEFDNEEESNKFELPEYFDTELTDDPNYKNKNLALKGKPAK